MSPARGSWWDTCLILTLLHLRLLLPHGPPRRLGLALHDLKFASSDRFEGNMIDCGGYRRRNQCTSIQCALDPTRRNEQYVLVPDGKHGEACHVEVTSGLSVALRTHSQYDEAVSFFRQSGRESTLRIAPRRRHLHFHYISLINMVYSGGRGGGSDHCTHSDNGLQVAARDKDYVVGREGHIRSFSTQDGLQWYW